jgi:hypothetical protein
MKAQPLQESTAAGACNSACKQSIEGIACGCLVTASNVLFGGSSGVVSGSSSVENVAQKAHTAAHMIYMLGKAASRACW